MPKTRAKPKSKRRPSSDLRQTMARMMDHCSCRPEMMAKMADRMGCCALSKPVEPTEEAR